MKQLAVMAWVIAIALSGAPKLALILIGAGVALMIAAYWP